LGERVFGRAIWVHLNKTFSCNTKKRGQTQELVGRLGTARGARKGSEKLPCCWGAKKVKPARRRRLPRSKKPNRKKVGSTGDGKIVKAQELTLKEGKPMDRLFYKRRYGRKARIEKPPESVTRVIDHRIQCGSDQKKKKNFQLLHKTGDVLQKKLRPFTENTSSLQRS